ncbi:MAG: addiction module protein [Oceanicaulis sp.]|nr:addiction module protein [Oceanicaulis sp.]MAZ91127.1 addiction module protein [Maricaulis sp.]MBI74949.1 addiction module protein [Oceanicaulis sp.]|tara:strand:+ start:315 stop:659 length:345 start_codon:yes stop_codon:yes gene_type:complete
MSIGNGRQLVVYEDSAGACPFQDWFDSLKPDAAAKVTTALVRLVRGLGDLEPVGSGVTELRIHWQAGYRVYMGFDGLEIVILLCGGTKRRQKADIERAKRLWADYRARKQRAGL